MWHDCLDQVNCYLASKICGEGIGYSQFSGVCPGFWRINPSFFALDEISLQKDLGRFSFVITGQLDHSLLNEDFTFNQNYTTRSVKP